MRKQKRISIAENKPIRILKERMHYGETKERCPFCIEHFPYLSASGYGWESAYECMLYKPQHEDARHASPGGIVVGDGKRETGEIFKGSPCLKKDWDHCPFNIKGAESK